MISIKKNQDYVENYEKLNRVLLNFKENLQFKEISI